MHGAPVANPTWVDRISSFMVNVLGLAVGDPTWFYAFLLVGGAIVFAVFIAWIATRKKL